MLKTAVVGHSRKNVKTWIKLHKNSNEEFIPITRPEDIRGYRYDRIAIASPMVDNTLLFEMRKGINFK